MKISVANGDGIGPEIMEAVLKIFSGIFGADMKVELLNDGPVTILIDTKMKE